MVRAGFLLCVQPMVPLLSPSYSSPCATHTGGAVGPPLLRLCPPGQVLVALNVFPPLPVSPDSSCFPSVLSLCTVSSCGRSRRPLPTLPTVRDRHPLGVRQVSMLLAFTNLSPLKHRGQSLWWPHCHSNPSHCCQTLGNHLLPAQDSCWGPCRRSRAGALAALAGHQML